MRIFWAVLIVILAGVGVVVFTGGDKATNTPAVQTAAETQASPSTTESDATTSPAEIARETASELVEDAPALDESDTVDAPVIEAAATEIAEEIADVESTEAETTETDEAAPGWDALSDNATENTEEAATEEAPAVVNLTITETDEGTLQIGDKFTITGKGTKDEPYLVPWDFLVAIRQAYSPREGRKDIPEHFAFFDGKYISIAGYLQFPLASPEPTECLVMLNQWDGCCIGVPPTPYDAIEVALSTPATQAQKFAVEGRIVGKLKIDPYLVGNWLIGLYLLNDAAVDVSGSRSAEEVYGNTPSQFLPGQ